LAQLVSHMPARLLFDMHYWCINACLL